MSEYSNIAVFVSDALRYDYIHDKVGEEAVIPTLSPSLHTPTSFASLFSGKSPENHKVRGFFDSLESDTPTAFDYIESTGFYDGETTTIRDVIGAESRDLDEMEEPFIWIERMMETHLRYGENGHKRNFEPDEPGQILYEKDRKGLIDVRDEYRKGVDVMWEHFQRHLDELEERGLLDETLVILTSDHGELLGERYLFRDRYDHNIPPLQQIVQVPTIFYNHEVDIESMRLIDLFPTAFSIAGIDYDNLGDGVDARKHQVKQGRNIMDIMPGITFDTKWRFEEGEWKPTRFSRFTRAVKTLATDFMKLFYSRGENLEQLVEENTKDEEKEEEIKNKLENLGYMDR